ncbi:MAG TPA: hypothetical protein VMW27_08925 [Thermoanaerobaculia bacterium]|nr:hypothetical protein [Thermoanaerobaculia bacterium]
MKKSVSRAVSLALALTSFLTVAPLVAEPAASAATQNALAQVLGLETPCAAAGAKDLPTAPEHRMSWWPDRCGACSSAAQCQGLLVYMACDPGDGGRGICTSTGEVCPGSPVEEGEVTEVSCYCDVIS